MGSPGCVPLLSDVTEHVDERSRLRVEALYGIVAGIANKKKVFVHRRQRGR